VEASIGPASITTLNSVRDQDLRSEHLPDMERYLTAGYRSTATREPAGGAWLVAGDLTLHGVTGPMELTVRFGGGRRCRWRRPDRLPRERLHHPP